MFHFEDLETTVRVIAGITGKAEGDCGWNTGAGPANRLAVFQHLAIGAGRAVGARQVHGDRVACITEADAGRGFQFRDDAIPDTDALITDVPGLALTVLVADCVPVFLLDPDRKAIGLAHAGREGTLQAIAAKTVQTMGAAFGSDPARVHAAIGPSAGPSRYEVSEEMAAHWAQQGLPERDRCLNLWEANRMQLISAGVPPAQIAVSGICTLTDNRFFSHRTDATGHRNMAVLMLRPD